tara:strand:- start:1964 stop:3247 length:1284 start_codon:yes stop_codon:yes gene_type:complete
MFLAYRVLTTILYPFLFIFIYFRIIIKKDDPERFKEKILVSHFRVIDKEKSKLIWFHAASIGEFKSVIPIINQLNTKYKHLKFLITTSSLSSGNLAEIELKKIDNAEHRYFPFDVDFLIDNFIHSWKPDKIFLVDSEIWPNLILKSKKYKIPIALFNARLTSKSINKWMIFPRITEKIFGIFNLFLCSNLETKKFLEELNLKNVYFKGNIKLYDPINEIEIENFNKNFLVKKRFWFAASTHKEEDLFCLKTHIKLKENFNDIITIIAPRHVDRSNEIKSLSEKLGLAAQVLDENQEILDNKEIIIVNYFGALKTYFKFAKSVFIGKSMIPKLKNVGGQNPIEAAKLECKIYHGPYVYNFEDIYKILESNNISKKIESFEELSKNLLIDLKNPQKKNNQNSNFINDLGKKTLNDTMVLIDAFLNDENK